MRGFPGGEGPAILIFNLVSSLQVAIPTLGGFLQLPLGREQEVTQPADSPSGPHSNTRQGVEKTGVARNMAGDTGESKELKGPGRGSRRRQPTAALGEAGSVGPSLLRF